MRGTARRLIFLPKKHLPLFLAIDNLSKSRMIDIVQTIAYNYILVLSTARVENKVLS